MLASAPAGSKIYALQQLRKFIRSSDRNHYEYASINVTIGRLVLVDKSTLSQKAMI